MDKFRILDCDIIYLSYDEPNAERNYADLCSKIPWAKRVHGVKGSDAAHKECARISETDRFITVDADNIVFDKFLNQEVIFKEDQDPDYCVISWAASNNVNGLIYGNGGIKCWPKKFVLTMKTHENADPRNKHAQVDFCWDMRYIQIDRCFSEIHNNATPHQAWRAGFREGVKMCLDRGLKPSSADEFFKNHWLNLHRSYIWMSVGADAKNGLWAIYGARQGFYKTLFTDWDYVNVREFDWLNEFWENEVSGIDESSKLYDQIVEFGDKIKREIDIPVPSRPLEPEASKFFKHTYQSPARLKTDFLEVVND